ncbi:MAG: type II secretion system protein [Planctomycetota bacterium]
MKPQLGGSRRGFSLIELLVSIGIVSILIALLLPTLSTSRERAMELVCIGKSRQIAGVLSVYAGEFDGVFPDLVGVPEPAGSDAVQAHNFIAQKSFLFQFPQWHEWSGENGTSSLYGCVAMPEPADDETPRGTSFSITASGYTAAGLYNPAVPDATWTGRYPGKLRRHTDARYTSDKVMVYELQIYHAWDPVHPLGDGHTLGVNGTTGRGAVAFMDGSARGVGSAEPSDSERREDVPWVYGRFNSPRFGIAGRDMQGTAASDAAG